MNTIIDTDALLGIFNTKDALHKTATSLLKKLKSKGVNTYLLPTTLSEFARLASFQIGIKEAQEASKALLKSGMPIIDITEEITKHAVEYYQKQTSKKESLFDCYVMITAKQLGINYIFSFDNGYTKKINGFKLAKDL